MDVVAMLRFGWGEDKAAAANKTPIKQNADRRRQARKKEVTKKRKKERKKERGCAHIHDEETRGFHSDGFPCWHGF